MKVFLDTNVLASAVTTRGLCADVLREVFANHTLIISEQVSAELRRVLRSKFGASQDLIDDFIRLLYQDSVIAPPLQLPKIALRDKDDMAVLGAAVTAEADVFITGDKELLKLGNIGGLEILSPRRFWEKLQARQKRRG